MIHRHLQIDPETTVHELPRAAIVDILERGDLEDWQPLARAIAREPSGELADAVLTLLAAYPMYGTSRLWRSWIFHCQAREEGRGEQPPGFGLADLRRESGLTQVELARRLGISQSDLSKLERRRDVRISTMRAWSRALGGTLRLHFESPRQRAEVTLPDQDDPATIYAGKRGGAPASPRKR